MTFLDIKGLRPTAGQQANSGSSMTQCSDCVWVGVAIGISVVVVVVAVGLL